MINKFTVPHFSRGESAVHSNVERMYVERGQRLNKLSVVLKSVK